MTLNLCKAVDWNESRVKGQWGAMTEARQESLTPREMLDLARATIEIEAAAVARVADQIDETLVAAVEAVEGTTGKVLITGSGTSSQVARRMAHLLSVSGTPAMFIHSMDALHGTVGAVQEDDLLIALSKTGESDEVVALARLVAGARVQVIGVGENRESSLAEVSDIFVLLHTAEGADPENTLAMGSTLVTAAWGDALARVIMARSGWRLEESLERHPAGGVGKLAREAQT